ncbi:serine phosphatase RsbU (regulator of sigma subunit) [Lipingzhangella halophila]|uniref:Serine phosphatase RsbU (Regulator of sigma subunit) n=1 Tax=Lipingzhangella halophila TaxID=1783352 RepID=A0A7W7W3K8_9ACTN|nr:GAF domain-containing SpoIIE family protein phosphatase [Lipingzhangella halophila]MBB4933162.1 serine phosphatase RsbU (regulator of sigma subunit) [Lipingzhangella halophila]
MLSGLLRASHHISFEELAPALAKEAARAGFQQTMVYVADLRYQWLFPLPAQYDAAGEPLKPIRIDTTMAGLAFRMVESVPARVSDTPTESVPDGPAAHEPRRLWLPLLSGAERIGVLGVTLPEDNESQEYLARQLASLVALVIASKRDKNDAYASLVHTDQLALSAEVLWNLLPAPTLTHQNLVLSAMLEPAHEVGGDSYDYGLSGDLLHLGIFDAMGHDLASGLVATIAMATFRNNRRKGCDLTTIADNIDKTIADQFDPPRFTTGVLATLNTRTGWLSWANLGHHPPLVLRQGRSVATLDTGETGAPMGLGLGIRAELGHYQMEPGDRLVFYTDGVIEARSRDGEVFGLERFTDFLTRREADGMPAPETLRRLVQTVLEHQDDRLQDDATVVLVEWGAQDRG